MKIATATYPLDWLESWAQYEDKLFRWVDKAASNGADLLVFPEYAAMELATLAGSGITGDLEAATQAVSEAMPEAAALHQHFAESFGVHILSGSGPVFADGQARPVNRAMLFAPEGQNGHQDKQIMTRWERDPWGIRPGGPLHLFNTALGKIGVLICYDSEFPLLGRALSEADMILVPSCTEALSGYWRVRIGAMARDELNVIPQWKQLFTNRVYQCVMVTHWEVGSTNRTRENHIPHPGQLLGLGKEHDVSRRMTRAVNNLEHGVTHRHGLTVLEPAVGLKSIRMGKVGHLAPLGQLVDPEAVALFRTFNRHTQTLA